MLKHLSSDKVYMDDGTLVGFAYNITELNSALSTGLKRQTKKKCTTTQTDVEPSVPRPQSPSLVDISWYQSIISLKEP